jgi:hypothetical protein
VTVRRETLLTVWRVTAPLDLEISRAEANFDLQVPNVSQNEHHDD